MVERDENQTAEIVLLRVATRLLQEHIPGMDWRRSIAEPPYDIGLDDVPFDSQGRLPPQLLEIYHFLDSFQDARWHGFNDLGSLSWDAAVARLREFISFLQEEARA